MFRFCGRKNPHPNLAKNARLGWGTREFEFAGKFPGSVVELELDWRAGQSEGLLLDGLGILADAGRCENLRTEWRTKAGMPRRGSPVRHLRVERRRGGQTS